MKRQNNVNLHVIFIHILPECSGRPSNIQGLVSVPQAQIKHAILALEHKA